jgi:ribokinase
MVNHGSTGRDTPAGAAPRVLVVGSANVDFAVRVERLPAPGETVTGGTLLVDHGGKGANQAVAARRLGAQVRFIGCVGDDASGEGVRQALAGEGIDVRGVVTVPGVATGTALIVVDAAGRNQIAVAPGANWHLTVDRAAPWIEDFAWAQVVLCQLEIPPETVAWALAEAGRRGARTVLNPAPMRPLPPAVLAAADCITPNAGEAERLTGLPLSGPAGAATVGPALLALGPRLAIVTLGEDGALVCEGAGPRIVPAFSVEAVDTTAAGDAFNGALAVGLGEGRELLEAVRFASAAAAIACTRPGAQASLPSRAEVDRLLATV